MMDPSVIKCLFEQGVCKCNSLPPISLYLAHVRRSSWASKQVRKHGGAEFSFTLAIIAIEELAKVDPSVSVLCDVHNTLINTVIRKYGTLEQQERWLPQLAESKARQPFEMWSSTRSLTYFIAWQLLFVRAGLRFRRVCSPNACHEGWGQLDHQWFQNVDHKLV